MKNILDINRTQFCASHWSQHLCIIDPCSPAKFNVETLFLSSIQYLFYNMNFFEGWYTFKQRNQTKPSFFCVQYTVYE